MSLNDLLSSEMIVWIEIIILGLCFLGGLSVIILGAVFMSKRQCSGILGCTVVLRGIALSLSFAYPILAIILSKTAGDRAIAAFSSIFSPLSSILALAYFVLLLVFCRFILRCKVWVIPVSAVIYVINFIAVNRSTHYLYLLREEIRRNREITGGTVLPWIIWFTVSLILLIAVNLIIIAVLHKGRNVLPQYAKISTFYIVLLCISFVDRFIPLAYLLPEFIYVLLGLVQSIVTIVVWIVFGVYLVKRANACAIDN